MKGGKWRVRCYHLSTREKKLASDVSEGLEASIRSRWNSGLTSHQICALTHKMRIDALKNQGLTLRGTP